MKKINLLQGDCLEQMKTLEDNSVDAIVTDPPYGISFMSKKWDYDVPSVEVWREALRVLKHGGHALIACGTRTQHRMVVNIEDAGFEIRDVVSWIYGSGFPKSLNVGKAIDKAAGAEREVVGTETKARSTSGNSALPTMGGNTEYKTWDITAPATEAAKQWDGWGTALKPACEFFTLARKPLGEPTVAANVLKHGTGAINVDGCRVAPTNDVSGWSKTGSKEGENRAMSGKNYARDAKPDNPKGRFPANLIHDGSQEVLELFPDSGGKSSSRFFYCAKASKNDRNEGCEALEEKVAGGLSGRKDGTLGSVTKNRNVHPTVKPTDLMRYLCRLITPPNGVVFDPFMGSGSTGKAAMLEGFDFIGCELSEDYYNIAEKRITHAQNAST